MARICLITNRHWRFDGRILNHSRALRETGHEVTIADAGPPAEWYRSSGAAGPPDVRVVRLDDFSSRLPSFAGRFVRRNLRTFLHGSRIRALAAIPADTIQASDVLTLRYALRAREQNGARVLYDIRDLYSAEWEGETASRVRRRGIAQEAELIHRADAHMTVCAGLATLVEERYGLRPVVVRNCRDPVPRDATGPEVRGALGLGDDVPLLVHTGQSDRGRALDALVQVIEALPSAHLALVGQQRGAGRVEELVGRGPRAGRIHLVPAVPAPQVPLFIRSATCAVIYLEPVSVNMRYALPNKFFEAVAARLPLVASDGEEMTPLIRGLGFGAVFDPNDPQEAVRAAREVVTDRDRYAAAADRAAEALSWQKERAHYLGIHASPVF